MTARPWMPFYIADYLADTQHLNNGEHGAYLLLLMHQWQHGSIPDDPELMARIARVQMQNFAGGVHDQNTEWERIWRVLKPYFQLAKGGLIQGRLAAEMEKAANISEKRRGAANVKHRKHNRKPKNNLLDVSSADADRLHVQNSANAHTRARGLSTSTSTSTKERDANASLRARDGPGNQIENLSEDWPPDYREQFRAAYPVDQDWIRGLGALEETKRAGKVSWAILIEAITKMPETVPPERMQLAKNYLEQERWNDKPVPAPPRANGKHEQRHLADELAEQARNFEGESGGTADDVGGVERRGNHAQVVSRNKPR